ncbi:MAG: hypothetical protein HYV29_01860 [Ignavibacteriales bacterium]|nr:hypothetical protein [Ignavibacteriales bacterium]
MKQKFFILAIAVTAYAMVSTGCATIMKGSEGNVLLRNAPGDLQVLNGNESLSISRMEDTEAYGFGESFKDEMNSTSTTYYAYGITLPNTSESYTLTLKSGDKSGTVVLKPNMAMRWFWLDLFIGGWLVDGITGNWNELAPDEGELKQIDVSKYLN